MINWDNSITVRALNQELADDSYYYHNKQ